MESSHELEGIARMVNIFHDIDEQIVQLRVVSAMALDMAAENGREKADVAEMVRAILPTKFG